MKSGPAVAAEKPAGRLAWGAEKPVGADPHDVVVPVDLGPAGRVGIVDVAVELERFVMHRVGGPAGEDDARNGQAADSNANEDALRAGPEPAARSDIHRDRAPVLVRDMPPCRGGYQI